MKETAPNSIKSDDLYRQMYARLGRTLSRWIDGVINRVAYPYIETRYFSSDGGLDLWVDDLIEVSSIAQSDDNGENYTAMTADDYILMTGNDPNGRGSYNRIDIDVTSADFGSWSRGQKAIRIIGEWGYTTERALRWQDTGDDLAAAIASTTATTFTVADSDGLDTYGNSPRFSKGQIIKIDTEIMQVVGVDDTTNTITVVRGTNGSTAATHLISADIYKWAVPMDIKQACTIQAIHQWKRGIAGFADASAMPDFGKVIHIKTIDPEAVALLSNHMRIDVDVS
jgi:hypothetical protein